MNIYVSPAMRRLSPRRMTLSSWARYLPFGYDVVAALRPRLVVDLGAAPDMSLFCFCQAMVEEDLDALCYAVGDWRDSDDSERQYFDDVAAHNRRHYRGFSYLMEMPLSGAVGHFGDNSVDLIHFNGEERDEAFEIVFADWYEKLSPGGLLLVHGITSPEAVGTAKAWRAQSEGRETFTFEDGSGLGVIRKPGRKYPEPELFQIMFGSDARDTAQLREIYAHAARCLELDCQVDPGQFGLIGRKKKARRA